MTHAIGCYVHIPFCVRKCAYCDFNSYSGYTTSLVQRYSRALEFEIRHSAEPQAVDTVFFGGGTPTAIPTENQAALLRAVLETLPVDACAEITTEANPGTADIAGLTELRGAGFNRISFGVQSFDAGLLKTMDRIHTADEARGAVRAARSAGFENISVDLMFGLPGQSMIQWRDSLLQALELGTDHISLYNLIVEDGTGFATLQRKGRLTLPDDDTTADMYQMAIDETRKAGLNQYEISNFARPGRESAHNIHYWRNDEYYGFGAGAVGYRNGIRKTNTLRPAQYCDLIERQQDLTHEATTAHHNDQMAEAMMLGLRLTNEGVHRQRFASRYGPDPSDVWPAEIERFRSLGLLEVLDDRLRLTGRGVFLANDVMMTFLN